MAKGIKPEMILKLKEKINWKGAYGELRKKIVCFDEKLK